MSRGRRGASKRGARDGKRRRRTKTVGPVSGPKPLAHPLFGDIPRVHYTVELSDGSTWEGVQCDPDYRPPMPVGAVRGDPRAQSFCMMCHSPRYFYVDVDKVCVQCGGTFVFSGREQKYWYEQLKFHFDSTAIRCPKCRRQRRTEAALQREIGELRARVEQGVDDPNPVLDLARAEATMRERRGHGGNVDRMIGWLRATRRRFPTSVETLYWEGVFQSFAGRDHKAIEALQAYRTTGRGRSQRDASRRLNALGES